MKCAKHRWPRQDRGNLISWRGKRDPSGFHFLYTPIKNSHLCVFIPRLFRVLFLPGVLEEGKGHHSLMAVSCDWVSTASPLLQRGLNIIFEWIFLAWLVPIYFSQNPCLVLSLVMVYYMTWTGQLCYNEYKFAGCSQNSCCFLRGTVSTLIETELISSPILCSGKGKCS